MDKERSIPSLIDGLKPLQRKVLFTCMKRKDKCEVNVNQLAGSVVAHSAFSHGEQALTGTIIGMAQNFVGSNNINILLPIGQFGSRLQGGRDAASAKYIFTNLNPLAKHLFSSLDTPLLNHLFDDNQKIEPEYYVPIIPMVLVNEVVGISTGCRSKICNYNPRDLVNNLLRMIDGREPIEMKPWFKNFRGAIEKLDSHHYVVSGEVAILENNKIEITELPIRVWTEAYKENVLETMLHGTDNVPASITEYEEYCTDTTVRFVVSMSQENFNLAKNEGFHRAFKLQKTISLNSMVLFDQLGCINRYANPEEILKDFFEVRSKLYERRKEYLVGVLEAELLELKNQARFLLDVKERKIEIENCEEEDVNKVLVDAKYDSDPIKAWKESQKDLNNKEREKSGKSFNGKEESGFSEPDYDYLWHMTILNFIVKKEEFLKKRDEKIEELENLKSKTPSDLWRTDLKNFIEELDKVEAEEQKEESGQIKSKEEFKPSPVGKRVVPQIDA